MTTRDVARARMVRKTLTVCEAHPQMWADVPAFAAAVGELREKLAQLEAHMAAAEVMPDNPSQEKKERRRVMVTRTLAVLNPLEVFADAQKDLDLKQATKTERGFLWNAPAERATAHCRMLLGIARAKQPELGAYLLTTERLEALEEAIAALEQVMALPLLTVQTRKARNAEIQALVAELTRNLNQRMDKLMYLIRERAPAFAHAYAAARVCGGEALTPGPQQVGTVKPSPPGRARGKPERGALA